jgi:hypothetical protein
MQHPMDAALERIHARLDALILANARKAINSSAKTPADTLAAPIIPPFIPDRVYSDYFSALLILSNVRACVHT